MVKTIEFTDGKVKMIDQTRLPLEKQWVVCKSYQEVAESITKMHIRGAPAIGVAAAYGMSLAALNFEGQDKRELFKILQKASKVLGASRPTAVNLFWAIERMMKTYEGLKEKSVEEIKNGILKEAEEIETEDVRICREIGRVGAELIKDNMNILTHCNAGALATADYGTALGVIRAAHEQNKKIHVFVDETRPYLQGARLTAWELMEENIDISLISDNMAGHFISRGMVDIIVLGADRIAANGDVANKIGTYSLGVLAKENGVPFYSAAPISTFDITLESGKEIPIEERPSEEITQICGVQIAPIGVNVRNPAFDVTPAKYLTGIITERGIIKPPYKENIKKIVSSK